jgi:hypothetical protein
MFAPGMVLSPASSSSAPIAVTQLISLSPSPGLTYAIAPHSHRHQPLPSLSAIAVAVCRASTFAQRVRERSLLISGDLRPARRRRPFPLPPTATGRDACPTNDKHQPTPAVAVGRGPVPRPPLPLSLPFREGRAQLRELTLPARRCRRRCRPERRVFRCVGRCRPFPLPPTATGRDASPANDNDQRLPGEGAGATTTTTDDRHRPSRLLSAVFVRRVPPALTETPSTRARCSSRASSCLTAGRRPRRRLHLDATARDPARDPARHVPAGTRRSRRRGGFSARGCAHPPRAPRYLAGRRRHRPDRRGARPAGSLERRFDPRRAFRRGGLRRDPAPLRPPTRRAARHPRTVPRSIQSPGMLTRTFLLGPLRARHALQGRARRFLRPHAPHPQPRRSLGRVRRHRHHLTTSPQHPVSGRALAGCRSLTRASLTTSRALPPAPPRAPAHQQSAPRGVHARRAACPTAARLVSRLSDAATAPPRATASASRSLAERGTVRGASSPTCSRSSSALVKSRPSCSDGPPAGPPSSTPPPASAVRRLFPRPTPPRPRACAC